MDCRSVERWVRLTRVRNHGGSFVIFGLRRIRQYRGRFLGLIPRLVGIRHVRGVFDWTVSVRASMILHLDGDYVILLAPVVGCLGKGVEPIDFGIGRSIRRRSLVS